MTQEHTVKDALPSTSICIPPLLDAVSLAVLQHAALSEGLWHLHVDPASTSAAPSCSR